MTRYPILLACLCLLLPLQATAGDLFGNEPSSSSSIFGDNVTVSRDEIGIDTYTDTHGNRTTVYHSMPGLSHYFSTDKNGHTTQGYLYEPMPKQEELRVYDRNTMSPTDLLPKR